jgi:hypothetical protein
MQDEVIDFIPGPIMTKAQIQTANELLSILNKGQL